MTGSTIKGGLPEHYEPLGQRIDPTPPLEDPVFPGPNDGFNDARFPEWQCRLYNDMERGYHELPVHCQKAYHAQNLWKTPVVLKREGNASRLVDSPLFRDPGPGNPSNAFAKRPMMLALRSTEKEDDPEITLPEEQVEVKIPLLDMSNIPGLQDASKAGVDEGTLDDNVREPQCVININFHNEADISRKLIVAAKKYATRAYGEAGVKVLFNRPDRVPARNSADIYLVDSWPEEALLEMKVTGWNPDEVSGWNSRLRPGTAWIRSIGYGKDAFAKLVTHETGHGFLYPNTVSINILDEPVEAGRLSAGNFHPRQGIMSYDRTDGFDSFTAAEKAFLSKCKFFDYRRR